MLGEGGRLIACGDNKQALYRFAGADSNAMDLIRDELKSAELPLNVTYRCPKSVVLAANRYVPDIVAHESNEDGIVREVNYTIPGESSPQFWKEPFTTDDVIVCRNTAPLVHFLYLFQDWRPDIPVRLEGSNPAQSYIALIDRMKANNLTQLLEKLEGHLVEFTQKSANSRPDRVDAMADKISTIDTMAKRLIGKNNHSVESLKSSISFLFGMDEKDGADTYSREKRLTLCTIHKSKGREWDRVYILGANCLMPSKWAKSDEDKAQEDNLVYVAITRAKRELVWVKATAVDMGMKMAEGK
jgi:superfamily I DNA/RNA helicase